MAEYIVQKPVDFTKLTAKARKSLPFEFGVMPKYDGCHAVFVWMPNGAFLGAFSATGEDVRSMQHVADYLTLNWKPKAIAICGEAWAPGVPFTEINGLFRRHSLQGSLCFAPFDAVTWLPGEDNVQLVDDRPWVQRMQFFADRPATRIVLLPEIQVMGLSAAQEWATSLVAQGGFDGCIARDLHAGYAVGRCKTEVIKLKPVLSLDLVITKINFAVGDKTGRDVFTIDVHYKGVETTVGSGMPHELGDITVGMIAEIECLGVYPDTNKLREPRFKGLRYDKDKADA